jgi:hypothetical protein
MPQAQKEHPPYITFELRAVEDRGASIEAGCYVAKDVAYVLITPAGSKDKIERVAEEWFANLKTQVADGRFPQEWFSAFQNAYTAWKEDRELPLDGTPILNWPVASPAQVKRLLDLHLRTVEQLSVANEECLQRLGMGGRALKQKAVEWIEQAGNLGKTVESVTALREQLKMTEERNDNLQQQIQALEQRVMALTKPDSAGKAQKL